VVAKVLCGCRGVLSVFFHCYSGARVFQLVTRVLLSYSKCVFFYHVFMQLQGGFLWLQRCSQWGFFHCYIGGLSCSDWILLWCYAVATGFWVVAKVLCGYKGVPSIFLHCYTGAIMFHLVARVLVSCSKCVFLLWYCAVAKES